MHEYSRQKAGIVHSLFDEEHEVKSRCGMLSIENVEFSLEEGIVTFDVDYLWGEGNIFRGIVAQVKNSKVIYYNHQKDVDMDSILEVFKKVGATLS